MDAVTLDFETRSACEIKFGGTRYSEDASTEVLCAAFHLPGETEAHLWYPAYPDAGLSETGDLTPLFDWVRAGGIIEAHNAQFERAIWENVCVSRMGWPGMSPDQWRCSASVCAYHALPRSLDGASKALGLKEEKDKAGNRIMLKVAKPRGVLKADLGPIAAAELGDAGRWAELRRNGDTIFKLRQRFPNRLDLQVASPWHEKAEELLAVFAYCQQDVMVEKAISDELGHLPESELLTWQIDQDINFRGVPLNLDIVARAQEVASECTIRAGERLSEITDGAVTSPTQASKIKAFVISEGFDLEGCAKGVLEEVLANQSRELSDKAREVIEIRLASAKSSTAKYVAMANTVGSEDRVRGTLAYHGADTGRWAGRLIQPQNFPRGTIKADPDQLADAILTMSVEDMELFYGNPMEVLATGLRGAIEAPEGREFIAADFSAVEARVGFWLAGDLAALDVFRRGEDIYKDMASKIYGVKIGNVTPDQRQVGKAAILGLGFQMGVDKFQDTALTNGMELELEFCESIVSAYRDLHDPVRQGWYEVEKAVLSAVRSPGAVVPFWNGKLKTAVQGDFLKIKLPSGRCIHYYKPFIKSVYSDKFDRWNDKIHFKGTNSVTRQFNTQTTYGGKLTENVVQATARDLMRDSMVRLHSHPTYDMVMSVHDELVCEVNEGEGSIEELEKIMANLEPWADGLPLEAEGWRGKRFRK